MTFQTADFRNEWCSESLHKCLESDGVRLNDGDPVSYFSL